MQKLRLHGFIIAALVVITFSRCGKDSPDPVPQKTKTELISISTWKFSAATVGGSDVSAFLQTCQKDNNITFVAAGTGTLDEGATKCNVPDPQTSPFTWNFLSSETQLFISATLFTGGSSTFSLVSLSETQLVVSQSIIVASTPQTAVVTFVH
jgi:hypothetical protein